ncbi:hypothetical protein BH10CHL1_BH10CHL1_25750 [soil metagenome]
MLPSAPVDPVTGVAEADTDWPAMPTETEIYILPDGRIVIADLPAELAPLLIELGEAELYSSLTQASPSNLEVAPMQDDDATDPYGHE